MNKVQEEQPSLLVIDKNLSEEEVTSLMHEAKEMRPQVRCLVLVDTAGEQRRLLSAGADGVLLRDSLSVQLPQAMQDLGLVGVSTNPQWEDQAE